MSSEPLRLLIYDDGCRGQDRRWPLTYAWIGGYALYRALGRLDAAKGVSSWEEALTFLADHEPDRPVAEIQFWGHGKWGSALVGNERLDVGALSVRHPLHELMVAVRARLVGPEALWWFRTCETFGAEPGHRFAEAWTDFWGCQAAGHTFIIGPWQSGLHSLRPGERPTWSVVEGLAAGQDPRAPTKAVWSTRTMPNTISCLHGEVPAGY